MKHLLLTLAVAGMSPCLIYAADTTDKVQQPTFTEWHDMSVNNVNRFPSRTSFFAYENRDAALKGNRKSSTPLSTTLRGRPCVFLAFGNSTDMVTQNM